MDEPSKPFATIVCSLSGIPCHEKKALGFKRPLFTPSFQMDGAVLAFIKRAFLGAVSTNPASFPLHPSSLHPENLSFTFRQKPFLDLFHFMGTHTRKKGSGKNFFWRESSYNEQRQREREKKKKLEKESKKKIFFCSFVDPAV